MVLNGLSHRLISCWCQIGAIWRHSMKEQTVQTVSEEKFDKQHWARQLTPIPDNRGLDHTQETTHTRKSNFSCGVSKIVSGQYTFRRGAQIDIRVISTINLNLNTRKLEVIHRQKWSRQGHVQELRLDFQRDWLEGEMCYWHYDVSVVIIILAFPVCCYLCLVL